MTDTFVKSPPPRPLAQQETLDSLNHWKTLFRNYYRRDTVYKQFLASDFTWTPNQPNYGLATQARKENLEDFLYKLAGFLPHSYLTDRIVKDTKSLQGCWDIIYEHYNVKITQETFLDFESLKKEPAENYRQFYEKLLQHSRLHLAPNGAKSEPLTNITNDSMTISLMNHVALQWLRKIDPQLINIIRTEYSVELRRGDQLSALVPTIAPNIDSLLTRHTGESVNRVKLGVGNEEDHHQPGIMTARQFRGERNNYRGRGRGGNFNQNELFCPGCFSISKELKISIDFKHRPSMCPRSVAVARYMQADVEDNVEKDEGSVNFDDYGKEPNENENIFKVDKLQNKSTAPEVPAPTTYETSHQVSHLVPNFTFNINLDCNKLPTSPPVVKPENTNMNVSDTKMAMKVRNLEERKHRWLQDKVRKEPSPRVKASVNDIPINPVIDEGSELNCLSEAFAVKNKIEISPTPCSASSADSTCMKIMGQTVQDLVVSPLHTNIVLWDLGKCVVMKNLSVDMLIGEPGKLDNEIITLPHLKKIKTKDINGKATFINYWHKNIDSPRHLCKNAKTMVMQAGEMLVYKLPPHLQNQTHVAISPIRDKQPSWVTPKVLEVSDGMINIQKKSRIEDTTRNACFKLLAQCL